LSLLKRGWPGLLRHGPEKMRLPNTLYVAFAGLDATEILKRAPLLLASTGAACHDRSCSMSHVLEAMGVDQAVARGTIRLSVGRHTTDEEIDEAADMLLSAAKQVAEGV
jgi:cysteine desulfurase